MAYGRIEETFWHDPKIRAMSEDARNLMLYLLTCPHKNRLGCFALDPYYAAADLQWNPDRVTEALVELNDRDRIAWDPDHRVVLIRRFLRYNTLENPNVVIGATNDLKALPDTPLLSVLSTVLEETKKSFYLPLLQELRNRLANSYPNGYPNGLPNPDHTRPYHTRPYQTYPPAEGDARTREGLTESDRRGDDASELADWLADDHADVVERFVEAVGADAQTLTSIFRTFGPKGTQGERILAKLDADEQRSAMAASLEALIGERQAYRQNFFRAILASNVSALVREKPEGGNDLGRRLPDDWGPSGTHATKASELGLDVESEAERFRLHAQANGRTQLDWDASFRLWLCKAVEFGGSASARASQPDPINTLPHSPSQTAHLEAMRANARR